MSKIRFGVVGYGNMGSSHAKWLSEGKVPDAELCAVCDIDEAKRTTAKNTFSSSVAIFGDYNEMLASGLIDAVIIAVPHYDHPTIAIAAFQKKLHVMVEKPAGVYTKQIKRMNKEASLHPELVFGMMFNQRMNPLYQKLKEILDGGSIGEIRRVNWLITSWWRTKKYYESSAWRATWWGEGGGVLVNQAPHQLDLLQWLCGKPTMIQGFLKFGSHREIPVEDDVTAYMEFANGATGVFITCVHDALGTDRLEIHGDTGKIIVENSSKVTVKRMFKSEKKLNDELDFRQMLALVKGEAGEKLYDEETFTIPEQWGIQHIEVLKNFTDAIVSGAPLVAPGADGINAVEIANAMHLSSWLKKPVNLPIDEDLYLQELNKHIEAGHEKKM